VNTEHLFAHFLMINLGELCMKRINILRRKNANLFVYMNGPHWIIIKKMGKKMSSVHGSSVLTVIGFKGKAKRELIYISRSNITRVSKI